MADIATQQEYDNLIASYRGKSTDPILPEIIPTAADMERIRKWEKMKASQTAAVGRKRV